MSSMVRLSPVLMLLAGTAIATPALAEDGREWDHARMQLAASQPGNMAQAVDRWKLLTASNRFTFGEYANFLITYPGFPMEEKVRGFAESALDREARDSSQVVSFFRRFPPLTNGARAHYALSLAALRMDGATEAGIAAWRGGAMSDASESALLYLFGSSFTRADHDARMDALLWANATAQAERQIAYVSPEARNGFMERLAILQGMAPGSLGVPTSPDAMRDTGYVYNRVRQARLAGNLGGAIQILSTRPVATKPALLPERWIAEMLTAARGAGASAAVRIAASVDDAFPAGTDVSRLGYKLRDDYTSLMWLGGTKALWSLGDARDAAPLFYRYGAAARTPGTRAKGFYWAGRAAAQAGDRSNSKRYFELAGEYHGYFYGMLALERLGRPLPPFDDRARREPTPAERNAFMARPITAAVRHVARGAEWRTTVQFFKEIAEQAESEADHTLVADLAREIGRRDLAVILGQSAHADGYGNFQNVSFPLIPVPPGSDWTVVHAITRQESQFAQNAVSHAGARGLMQLMPGTAREQAGIMGLGYDVARLISDPEYNIRLGDAYFERMMRYHGGSFPLAAGSYNAGAGNVNKWLRANGDPRTGGIDWVEWVERIPIYETKNYIQRVLENAVVYEAMYPAKARYRGPNPLSNLLGKRTPG